MSLVHLAKWKNNSGLEKLIFRRNKINVAKALSHLKCATVRHHILLIGVTRPWRVGGCNFRQSGIPTELVEIPTNMCVFYQKFRQQRRFFNKIPTIRSNFCQKSDKSDGHFQKWGGATPPTPPLWWRHWSQESRLSWPISGKDVQVSTFSAIFREGFSNHALYFLGQFYGRIFMF